MDIKNMDLKKLKYILLAAVLLISAAGYTVYERSSNDKEVTITKKETEPEQKEELQNTKDKTANLSDQGKENVASAAPTPEYIYVDVSGAVNSPMVVCIPYGSRVFEAIDAAGGRNPESSVKYLNLASICEDGQKIYVPTKDEIDDAESTGRALPGQSEDGSTPETDNIDGSTAGVADQRTAGTTTAGGKININTAGSEELQTLPGVGPAIASRIIDYRNTRGSFQSTEEIKSVSGIGEKIYEKLKDEICV